MLTSRPTSEGGLSGASPRLGEMLVAEGVIRNRDLSEALRLQRYAGGLLGTNLLERGSLSENQLLGALGKHLRASTIAGIRLRRIPQHVIDLIPADIARRYQVVPFQILGSSLRVAAIDPRKAMLVEQALGSRTSLRVRSYVALEFRIYEALKRYYGQATHARIDALTHRMRKTSSKTEAWSWQEQSRSSLPAPTDSLEMEEALLHDSHGVNWDEQIVISTPETGAEMTEVHVHSEPSKATPPSFNTDAYVPPLQPRPRQEVPVPATPEAAPASPLRPSMALMLSELDADARLEEATSVLQQPLSKNQVAQVVLDFCRPYLKRRVLFLQRQDRIVGWRASGDPIDQQALQLFWVKSDTPSVFFPLTRGSEFWLGPMPAFGSNRAFKALLGGTVPPECAAVPIELRKRAVAFIYGDNLGEGVGQVPIKQMRRLAAKAGLAFELCILRGKLESA